MVELAFENSSRFKTTFLLDERNYIFYLNWNSRGGYWALSILQPNNESPIIEGIKLVPFYNLLEPYTNPDLPKNPLFVVLKEEKSRIEKTDFIDGKASLVYND